MLNYWPHLIGNFAVVALFFSLWGHAHPALAKRTRRVREIVFGLTMGSAAITTMVLAVGHDVGVLFDLRYAVLALAALFGGPRAAVASATMAAVFRLSLGGDGVVVGVVGIGVASFAGWATGRIFDRLNIPMVWTVATVAAIAGIVGVALGLAVQITVGVSPLPWLAFALMNTVAVALSAFLILRSKKAVRAYDLLYAAFMQGVGYQYVKTPDGHYAAANIALANRYGLKNPEQVVGKTEFDFNDARRAGEQMREDVDVIDTGIPVNGRIERRPDRDGMERWYTSSKVPLRNVEGEIIGLAGMARDITAQRRLEQQVVESRNQLDYVLTEIRDGIAMFDKDGVLVYCNENYRGLFPRTSELRRPGVHLRDILDRVVETGEQLLPTGHEGEWIDEVLASLKQVSEEEVALFDGRWLYIRTRPTAQGSALVVVSDVTKIKLAEESLRTMTEQLKLLAATDGLTGLTNRRAFDAKLEAELGRCRRSGEPISVLLGDVDYFKAYNDIYGHQAGDRILKTVADCLRGALRRPSDVAARYGGEEFVAVLPGTGEDGAFLIADAFRSKLAALQMPHDGSVKGYVTVSVGIATFTEEHAERSAAELVRRADEALYSSKGAGRDRVMGWRPHHEIEKLAGSLG